MDERNTGKNDKPQANVGLDGLLDRRCATCVYWDGNRSYVAEKLMDAIKESRLADFLNPITSWAAPGYCKQMDYTVCLHAEPDGVFGCIMYESI